ncbi:MAG: ABC-2 family transporter protein [Chloroflexi bacterium]|nr:ABC-2 family transporter protein [Chloroflexota bacterium]MCI0729334.1 ABC-2 family transporter protein [Chloroflexota bacterium]
MADSLRLYFKFIGIAFRARLEYRSDFLVGVVGVLVLNLTNLTLIWVLIAHFRTLGTWSYWEIVMLYSMWLLGHSVYAVFFWHLSELEVDILSGRFDQYLVRPCSPLLQFLGREVNYFGVGDILFATTAFSLAYRNLALDWSAGQWLFFMVSLLAGLIIETSITWIAGSLSFWLGRSKAIHWIAMRFSGLTQNYPLDIFGQWFRLFITGFLPVAFMNYYPLTVLLGKPNAFGVASLGFLSPLVAMILLALAALVWRRGIASYTSSGS